MLEILAFKHINESSDQQSSVFFRYNYLLGLAMSYMMFMILSGITIYKSVNFGWFIMPAAVLVTPFIYSISNITTEVYGYLIARNMMWWFIIVSAIFTSFGFLIIHTPSPQNFANQYAFNLILGNMPIVFVAGIIGSIGGISFNNYVVSKYKVLLNGRKYWLRSILSTAGGEMVYNLIAYPLMFIGHTSTAEFFHILISVSLFKITTTALIWPLECLSAAWLKRKEGISMIDKGVNYNIFRFRINQPQRPKLKIVK